MSMQDVKKRFTCCDELQVNPCRNCVAPRRFPGCHDECADYKAWRKEWDKLQENIRKQRDAELLSLPLKPSRKRK